MKINIAIGKSRKDTRWKNKEIPWEQFVTKLKTTQRTHETLEEYKNFDKDRQAEIKDVGGFVGGHLIGGRRLKTAVMTRSLITLDVDTEAENLPARFQLHYDCNAVIYSTHKHEPGAERYRLIIPLSREVLVDEFTAISRKIAEQIGINSVDRVSYMPHNIMYWPSTSKDAKYFFQEFKGYFLDPDTVLDLYTDWTDISQWPTSNKENKAYSADAKKQGEPAEKPGQIGAFNRAYTIEDAIEMFIPDVYIKSDKMDNRYTYADGSSANGAIVYDNKFLYSVHSTDPVSHTLCNAFDLIRLHKFGDLDADCDPSTPVNKRPSYVRMSEFVSHDTLVKQQIGEAKLLEAAEAFKEVPYDKNVSGHKALTTNKLGKHKNAMIGENRTEAKKVMSTTEKASWLAEQNTEWLQNLDVDSKGNYQSTINNIVLILDNDPIFVDNIAYDEFEQIAIFRGNVPWRKVTRTTNHINEHDLANIENHIERVYKISTGDVKLKKALLIIYNKYKFHPVKDYINSLTWDGKARIEEMFIYYFGAEDNIYTRDVAKKVMTAAIARVFDPGCKFDNIVVLVGPEGMGKSTFWSNLGGPWFSDTFNMGMLQNRTAYEQLQGTWIIEIGELAGMAKAEVERVKNFVSAGKDKLRFAYGKNPERRFRENIFVASVNTLDFLKSQDGNRRFWPVPVGVVKNGGGGGNVFSMGLETVDQLWAEAKMMFDKGETLHLTNMASNIIAKHMQQEFTEENPLAESIDSFLEKLIPKNWYQLSNWDKLDIIQNYETIDKTDFVERTKVCKYEIWELCMGQKGLIPPHILRQIKQYMRDLEGWKVNKSPARFGNYPMHRFSWHKDFEDEMSGINVEDLL